MDNKVILQNIDCITKYFEKSKNNIYQELEKLKVLQENIFNEICESKRFLEIEETKEQDDNNIFNLFMNSSSLEKQLNLKESMDEKKVECIRIERFIDDLEKKLKQIESNLKYNQSVKEYIENNEIENELKKVNNQFGDKIELCIDLIELDKERCKLELKKIVEDLRNM